MLQYNGSFEVGGKIMRYLITFAYDGSKYKGYQKQPKVTQYIFCKSSHVSNTSEFETDFLLMDRRTFHIITDKLEGYIYRLDKLENVAYDDKKRRFIKNPKNDLCKRRSRKI